MVEAPTLSAPLAFHPFDRVDGKVHAHQLINPGFASIIARKNRRDEIDPALMTRFGFKTPEGAGCRNVDSFTIIGTAPDSWLCYRENGGVAWAPELQDAMKGIASVVDQSSGYVLVRMAGEKSRDVLQQGVYVDLHPSVFKPGCAAMTDISHISVLLAWPRADGPYYLAIPRSYAGSFRHWLDTASGT